MTDRNEQNDPTDPHDAPRPSPDAETPTGPATPENELPQAEHPPAEHPQVERPEVDDDDEEVLDLTDDDEVDLDDDSVFEEEEDYDEKWDDGAYDEEELPALAAQTSDTKALPAPEDSPASLFDWVGLPLIVGGIIVGGFFLWKLIGWWAIVAVVFVRPICEVIGAAYERIEQARAKAEIRKLRAASLHRLVARGAAPATSPDPEPAAVEQTAATPRQIGRAEAQ